MADPDFYRKIAHQRYENAAQVAQEAGATSQAALNDAYLNLYGVNGSTDWTPDENWAEQFEQYNDVPMYVPNYNQQKALETEAHKGEGQAYVYDRDFRARETPETAASKMQNTPNTAQEAGGFQDEEQARKRAAETEQAVRDSVNKIFGENTETKSNVQSGYEQEEQAQEREQDQQDQPVEASSNVTAQSVERPEDVINTRNLERQNEDALNPSVASNSQSRSDEDYRNDSNRLAELQQELYDEQQRRLEQGRDIYRNQLLAQYGATGADVNDPVFQQTLADVDNMTELPYQTQEVQRRFFDRNGNFEANPLNWNLLGFTSQQQSSDAARNLYDYWYNMEENQKAEQERQPYIPRDNEVVDRNMIDDGTSEESREGIYMSGDQYLRYRNELGIPGRPVDEIQPDRLYSKQDEMVDYGFVPYIASDYTDFTTGGSGADKFHNEASIQAVNRVFNDFANARRDNADFTINVGDRNVSGQDFLKQMDLQGDNLRQQLSNPENYTYSENAKDANEYSIPYDGVRNEMTGEVKNVAPSQVEKWDRENGTAYAKFPDGSTWEFANVDQMENSLRMNEAADASNAVAWNTIKPEAMGSVKLSDGSTIDAITAFNLMSQISNGGGENIDYGPFSWSKPTVELPEANPQAIGQWFANGEFAPWFADMALGSAPFFWMPTGATRGVGRAWSELGGMSPDRNTYNGTYSMISENPTREQAVSQALGSAAMPFTEHLWGPLGSKGLNAVFPKLAAAEKTWSPTRRWATGTLGEALEEIPGNLTEELERSGFQDFYKNEVEDQYDAQGRPLRTDTDALGRTWNFVQDIPEAMIGGASLGGVLGLPSVPGYRRDYRNYLDEISRFGDNLEQPGESGRRLTEEERDYYNR